MTEIEILKIESGEIHVVIDGVNNTYDAKTWRATISKIKGDYKVTLNSPIEVGTFDLTSGVIARISPSLDDLLIIPGRRRCLPQVRNWINTYLECAQEVGYEPEDMLLMQSIMEVKDVHLYRGKYIDRDLLKVGSTLSFKYITSWSMDESVSTGFARDEQRAIEDFKGDENVPCLFELSGEVPCYVPIEYCDKPFYLLYCSEQEVSVGVFDAEITDINTLEGDENRKSPIRKITLKSKHTTVKGW